MPSGSAPSRVSWRQDAPLRPVEREMVAAARAGKQAGFAQGPFDLATMKAWGSRRTIRAAVLRHLLVEDEWRVHARGVQLRGVRITGHLDLEAATLRCPLRLEQCYFSSSQPVSLDYASCSLLVLASCRLAGLNGDLLRVSKELDVAGSTFTKQVRLLGADITGSLSCKGARLTVAGKDGSALIADRLRVGGSVLLDEGFTAAGAVRLPGADITGQLRCKGAHLSGADKDGDALIADGLKVGGDLFLNGKFTTAGAVRLPEADIAGQLRCTDAQLTAASKDGSSLFADRMKVGGSVFLDGKFTAAGTIRLPGARITGRLRCTDAQLESFDQNHNALLASGIWVGGDVFLDKRFTAKGAISLRTACLDSSLYLMPSALAGDSGETAVDATGAKIAHTLRWAPSAQVTGRVILEGAAAGLLEDDWATDDGPVNGYWPQADAGMLRLDGFTYAGTSGQHPATLEQRLAWIGSQPRSQPGTKRKGFSSQPYEQLARVYQQAGQDKEARKVAIARRRDLRKYGDLSPSRKLANWLLEFTIQYGYQTWRAVAGIAVLYLIVLLVFWYAQHRTGVIVPVQATSSLSKIPTATNCTSDYPCFYPAGYAIDTVIPLINVHQADYWGPNANTPFGWIYVAVTWVGILLGWAFATLAVAGYTGLVRNADAL